MRHAKVLLLTALLIVALSLNFGLRGEESLGKDVPAGMDLPVALASSSEFCSLPNVTLFKSENNEFLFLVMSEENLTDRTCSGRKVFFAINFNRNETRQVSKEEFERLFHKNYPTIVASLWNRKIELDKGVTIQANGLRGFPSKCFSPLASLVSASDARGTQVRNLYAFGLTSYDQKIDLSRDCVGRTAEKRLDRTKLHNFDLYAEAIDDESVLVWGPRAPFAVRYNAELKTDFVSQLPIAWVDDQDVGAELIKHLRFGPLEMQSPFSIVEEYVTRSLTRKRIDK